MYQTDESSFEFQNIELIWLTLSSCSYLKTKVLIFPVSAIGRLCEKCKYNYKSYDILGS